MVDILVSMLLAVVLVVSVLLLLGVVWLVLRTFAALVVLPWKPKHVDCLAREGDTATFRQTPATTAPGKYAVWLDGRTRKAVIGDVLDRDDVRKTVTREVLSEEDGPLAPGPVEWIGMIWTTPEDLDLEWSAVAISTPTGVCPAWLFPGSARPDDWVIHVHGLRVNRDSPLRGVPAAAAAGVTSLVVTYRADGEGPTARKDATTLGQTEWQDVDAAVSFALEHGARTITLMGWSQGGGIALRVAEQSAHREYISDLVLVGPATNWAEIIAFGAKAVRVPRWVSAVVVAALGWGPFARSVGLPDPLDFAELAWTDAPRLSVPALVLHSADDDEVPIELSRRLAEVNPGLVTLAEFSAARHTMEWNVDRARFDRTITEWLSSSPRPRGRGSAIRA